MVEYEMIPDTWDGYQIRQKRAPIGEYVASCSKHDDAEKIVKALNEMEKRRVST